MTRTLLFSKTSHFVHQKLLIECCVAPIIKFSISRNSRSSIDFVSRNISITCLKSMISRKRMTGILLVNLQTSASIECPITNHSSSTSFDLQVCNSASCTFCIYYFLQLTHDENLRKLMNLFTGLLLFLVKISSFCREFG